MSFDTTRSAGEPVSLRYQQMWRLGFWAADWTPWRALSAMAHSWPQLRFETRPLYDQAA